VIAAAANVQFAIEEIKDSFVRKTGIPCEVVLSSSGKLTAQIAEGAPYDVFISADLEYPNVLFGKGLSDKPVVYAKGQVILWTSRPLTSLQELKHPNINHIAVANPRTAPYGKASVQLCKDIGMLDDIQHKFVYGESISQVNQFIKSGTVQAAFTSKSVVLAESLKGLGYWFELDDQSYEDINQGIVVVSKSQKQEEAALFKKHLLSKDSERILRNFGYKVESREN